MGTGFKDLEDIHIFVTSMTFISSGEVKKYIFHEWRSHEKIYNVFTSRDHIHDKKKKKKTTPFYYIQRIKV